MPSHTVSTRPLTAALAAGAVAATLATASVGAAPDADASCFSIFGIGNGGGCTSTVFSAAVAIGNGAVAHASGLFGAAVALGADAEATTADLFDFGVALGTSSRAHTQGIFGIALASGGGSARTNGMDSSGGGLGLNVAVNLAGSSPLTNVAEAQGLGNTAVNLFGGGNTNPIGAGVFNTALNVGGNGNEVWAYGKPGSLSTAFALFSTGTFVGAGPGPFAVAGSLFQTNADIEKTGPGFNINGLKVFAASAVTRRAPAAARTTRPAAATAVSLARPQPASARRTSRGGGGAG